MAKANARYPDSKDLHEFSVSRLGTAAKCGLAFRYQYVDHLPAPQEKASAMFGHVLHDGLQAWYQEGPITPDNQHRHKDLDLVECVRDQWKEQLPPAIYKDVQKLREFDVGCEELSQALVASKGYKAPRQTKLFLESAQWKEFLERKDAMLARIDAQSEIKWPKNENPWQAYQKSLIIATRLQNEWRPLPRPLLVEMPFTVEIDQWKMHGRIDQVRLDPDLDSGQIGLPEILDAKTNAQPLTQMMAFLQAYVYYEGVAAMEEVETTTNIAFALLRHRDERGRTKVQRGQIDPKRHRALALRILHGKTRQVLTGQFEPSYGFWCKNCDFEDLCSNEIRLWQGDGIVAGTEVKVP